MELNTKSPNHHYNFCSRCKGEVAVVKEERELKCISCGFHFYINPTPCNGLILINTKGEIVLIRRKYNPGKGMLDVPGGFVDINENFEQSLTREIKEELGIELKDFEYLGSYEDRYLFEEINYYTIGVMFFYQMKEELPLQALDDVGELETFKIEDIPYVQIAFPMVKKAISDYLRKIGYN